MEKDYSQRFALRILTLLLWAAVLAFAADAAADIKSFSKFLSDSQLNQGVSPQSEIFIPAANQPPTNDKPVTRPPAEQRPTPPRENTRPGRDIDIRDVIQIFAPIVVDQIKRVAVPNLKGKTAQEAKTILSRSKLKLGKVDKTKSKEKSEIIIRQFPAARKMVTRGSAVDVTVSIPVVEKPSVVNIDISPSRQTLQQGKFARFSGKVSIKRYFGNGSQTIDLTDNKQLSWLWRCGNQTSNKKTFTIDTGKLNIRKHKVFLIVTARSTPGAAAMARLQNMKYEKTASLIITQALIRVPSVLNKDIETAKEILEKAGLAVGQIKRVQLDSGNHTVIKQRPRKGDLVSPGSAVSLDISIPEPLPEYKIQIQSNKATVEENEAVTLSATLTPRPEKSLRYQFIINGESHPSPNNQLTTRFKTEGVYTAYVTASINNGKAIESKRIRIQVKSALVTVPPVVEETLSTAETMLKKSGLRLGEVYKIKTASGNHTITEQLPIAGTKVRPGKKVSVTVAVPLPDYKLNLESDKHNIDINEQVSFTAKLTPVPDKVVSYKFFINDNIHSTENNRLESMFQNPGNHEVYATAKVDDGRTMKSHSLTIIVNEAWEMPISKIKPASVNIKQGEPVVFINDSKFDKRGSATLTWSAWNGKSGTEQNFTTDTNNIQPGQYWVTLTVTDSRSNTDKSQAELIIEPLKNKWVWWLPIALGGFGMAAIGYAIHKSNTTASTSVKKLKSPRLSYLPETDLGTQSVSENADSSAAGLCVQVETDIGEQAISTYSDKQEKNDG